MQNPLTAPKASRPLPPAGTTLARLIRLIHIGTYNDTYQGEPVVFNKIRLTFELPEETISFKEGEAPKPFLIDQEYSLSLGKKANLRKLVEGMIGRPITAEEEASFDVLSLVGKPCMLNIVRKISASGNERAEIATATPVMKGLVCKDAVNPLKILTYTNWDEDFFQSLPAFIKDKMQSTQEYTALKEKQNSNIDPKDLSRVTQGVNYPTNENDPDGSGIDF